MGSQRELMMQCDVPSSLLRVGMHKIMIGATPRRSAFADKIMNLHCAMGVELLVLWLCWSWMFQSVPRPPDRHFIFWRGKK